MRLLDRYLLRQYLLPVVYCLAGFCLIYIVVDLFDHLPRFMKAEVTFPRILSFYGDFLISYQSGVSFMVVALPISLLAGALYSLARLTRNSEITAMRASGISLYRIMLPFIGVGLAASLLGMLVQETVAPAATRRVETFTMHLLKVEKRPESRRRDAYIEENFAYYNPLTRRQWLIPRFDLRTPHVLRNVGIKVEDASGRRIKHIHALWAHWLDGHWWFTGMREQLYDNRDLPVGSVSPRLRIPVEMRRLTETPGDLITEVRARNWDSFSAREMLAFLAAHPDIRGTELAIKKVNLHGRLAMPWTCLIVVLIGIPIGARTGRQGILAGVLMAIGVFFSFYVCMQLGMLLGKKAVIPPWSAAWIPIIAFLVLGGIMTVNMRSTA